MLHSCKGKVGQEACELVVFGGSFRRRWRCAKHAMMHGRVTIGAAGTVERQGSVGIRDLTFSYLLVQCWETFTNGTSPESMSNDPSVLARRGPI